MRFCISVDIMKMIQVITATTVKWIRPSRSYVFALSTLLDLICHGFRPSEEFREAINALDTPDSGPLDSDLGKAICHVLECVDPLRVNYWLWRKSKLPLTVSNQ